MTTFGSSYIKVYAGRELCFLPCILLDSSHILFESSFMLLLLHPFTDIRISMESEGQWLSRPSAPGGHCWCPLPFMLSSGLCLSASSVWRQPLLDYSNWIFQCNKALWKKGQFSASYGNIENPGKAKLILNNKSTAGGVTTASLT